MIVFLVIMALLLIGTIVGITIAQKGFDPNDKYELKTRKLLGRVRLIACIAIAVVSIAVFTIGSIKIIDATEVGVVRVFGRIDREIAGGLNFVNPISERVTTYDLTAHMKTAEFATYTKDAQPLTASVDYQYSLREGEVMAVAREFGNYEVMEAKLNAVVEEKVKAVFARYGGMSLLENRATISDEVFLAIKELEDTYHVKFVNAVVNNIDFSDAFEASVEAKMTAEQEALRAEQEKKTAIVKAEQARETALINAEAEVATAQGEADAMNIKREALANMPDIYIQQMFLEHWNGELPRIMGEGFDYLIDPSTIIGE